MSYYLIAALVFMLFTAEANSECNEYNRGGSTGFHYFTCCDNSNDLDQSCVGLTFQGGGSSNSYCGQKGLSNPLGGGNLLNTFDCVNCEVQRACESRCNTYWLYTNFPGFCPNWAMCFKECCLSQVNERGKRQIDSMQFCGDFTCQSGENSTNCPIDCCLVTNPTDCRLNSDTCNPGCCLEPQCCVTVGNSGSDAPKSLMYFMVLPLLMTMCAIHN